MLRSRQWAGWAVALLSGCSGYGVDLGVDPDDVGTTGAAMTDDVEVAEIVVRNRVFLRRDLWSSEDIERIGYEGRPNQKSDSAEVLAAQLRGHMLRNGIYYIELEPNLDLAERILRGEGSEGTPSQPPREGRRVIGSDSRAVAGNAMAYPGTTFGFQEIRCTGTKIGRRTMYTAAHCVYETFSSPNGWYCDDESVGSCTNRPRWRFGVNGMTGFTNWTPYNCHGVTIPTAFVNLTSSSTIWEIARFDFAAVDMTGCGTDNTGWLGTIPADDATLLGIIGYNWGYPARATCPAGALGQPGFTTNGTNVLGTDCPGTGNWPGSTWQLNGTAAPYSGARLWVSNNSNVSKGDVWGDDTIKSTVDITNGHSGGSLYYIVSGSDRRVVGCASTHGPTFNTFNRWTTGVHNFVAAFTPFPDDTL